MKLVIVLLLLATTLAERIIGSLRQPYLYKTFLIPTADFPPSGSSLKLTVTSPGTKQNSFWNILLTNANDVEAPLELSSADYALIVS